MQFTKMHGAGNDYIYVNCFDESLPARPDDLARSMSDRHFGVGGDGLVLICPSEVADVQMRMFNADGSEAEMCGNAVRCIAKFVFERNIARANPMKIETGAGVLRLDLLISGDTVDRVRVDMGEPILPAAQIPTTFSGERVVDAELTVAGRTLTVTCVSMGNPHCVIFVDDPTDDVVLSLGPQIEVDAHFPNRVNAEFVQVLSRSEVRQRTWERGSGETLACGTGACAVCVAGVLTDRTDRQIIVHLPGGDLEIEWSEADNHVYMTGPATEVYSWQWPR